MILGQWRAFMPLYIAKSGDLDRCYRCLTDWQTTLKDRATQLLIKYKSGALVTQFDHHWPTSMNSTLFEKWKRGGIGFSSQFRWNISTRQLQMYIDLSIYRPIVRWSPAWSKPNGRPGPSQTKPWSDSVLLLQLDLYQCFVFHDTCENAVKGERRRFLKNGARCGFWPWWRGSAEGILVGLARRNPAEDSPSSPTSWYPGSWTHL